MKKFKPIRHLFLFEKMRDVLNSEGSEGLNMHFGVTVSEYCKVLGVSLKMRRHSSVGKIIRMYNERNRLGLLVVHGLTMEEAEKMIEERPGGPTYG